MPTLGELRGEAPELTSDLLLEKSFPAGIRRVREHRELGHRTLLITGALDFVLEPFRPLFDDVVCAHMTTINGEFNRGTRRGAANGRGEGADYRRSTPRTTASTWPNASPMPTRRATCPCWKPPASR